MSASVDWGLAGRVARLVAQDPARTPGGGDLDGVVAEATAAVIAYTGLEPSEPLPEPEWVSRERWVAVNLDSLRAALAPFEDRLAAGGPSGPIGAGIGAVLGHLSGAQLGALVGFASRQVLGQYEYPVLGPDRPPRLLFVAANLRAAEARLGGERRAVLRWIALHEVTHAVHFASAPWMRGHLRGLAAELLEGSRLRIDLSELGRRARLAGTDPRALVAELRASDPLSLLIPPSSRELLARTQAAMAAIEGFAEHVMDAAALELGEEVSGLRSALERRREGRSPPARLLAWLLGIELKLRQYRDGKRFCDAVVELEGVERLNDAWRDAGSLPTVAELADPAAWLRRTAPAHA